jgi:hypothetical protein
MMKKIDEVLSSSSTITPEEIAMYQEDLDAYYAENYKFNSQSYGRLEGDSCGNNQTAM